MHLQIQRNEFGFLRNLERVWIAGCNDPFGEGEDEEYSYMGMEIGLMSAEYEEIQRTKEVKVKGEGESGNGEQNLPELTCLGEWTEEFDRLVNRRYENDAVLSTIRCVDDGQTEITTSRSGAVYKRDHTAYNHRGTIYRTNPRSSGGAEMRIVLPSSFAADIHMMKTKDDGRLGCFLHWWFGVWNRQREKRKGDRVESWHGVFLEAVDVARGIELRPLEQKVFRQLWRKEHPQGPIPGEKVSSEGS